MEAFGKILLICDDRSYVVYLKEQILDLGACGHGLSGR